MTDRSPNEGPARQGIEAVPRLAIRRTEAAAGLSPRSIDVLLAGRTSGFPYLKCGSRVVIPVRELVEWLAQQAYKKGRRSWEASGGRGLLHHALIRSA